MKEELTKDAIIRILSSMVGEAYHMGRLDHAINKDGKWTDCIIKEHLERLLERYWDEDDLV